jgi:hypothetical protein
VTDGNMWVEDVGGRIRIADAPPRTRIGVSMLQWINHMGQPPSWVTRDGDVLTFADDFGHRWIYVIGDVAERDADGRALSFWMEWPD